MKIVYKMFCVWGYNPFGHVFKSLQIPKHASLLLQISIHFYASFIVAHCFIYFFTFCFDFKFLQVCR